MLSVAGADHIITIDLHASQIQVGGGRGRGEEGRMEEKIARQRKNV